MSIHSKGQNPKTWKPGEEIFVSALELVLASLTLVSETMGKFMEQ